MKIEINWIEGKDEDGFPTIDPQDGEGPIILWKDDVRGKEECLQIQKAYERGVKRGRGELGHVFTQIVELIESGVISLSRGAEIFGVSLSAWRERLKENYNKTT